MPAGRVSEKAVLDCEQSDFVPEIQRATGKVKIMQVEQKRGGNASAKTSRNSQLSPIMDSPSLISQFS